MPRGRVRNAVSRSETLGHPRPQQPRTAAHDKGRMKNFDLSRKYWGKKSPGAGLTKLRNADISVEAASKLPFMEA